LRSVQVTAEERNARSSRLLQLLLLASAALYLYLNLFTVSNTPFLLEGDQNFFWAYGMRMLQGQLPYRDFFQFTTPGTDLFFMGMFATFGPHIWVTDVAIVVLGVALCWACHAIAIRIMPRDWALLTTALFLVCVYGWILDATHHWFSLLAILCAVRVLMCERTPVRVAFAGALLGIACFLTQAVGAAGVLALFAVLAWERLLGQQRWRFFAGPQLVLLISSGLTWGALSAYFFAQLGWQRLWYFWVVYPLRYLVTTDPLFRFGPAGQSIRQTLAMLVTQVQHGLVLAVLVLVYPVVWWYCWRKRQGAFRDAVPLMLLSLSGFVLFLEAIARPNWGRIYSVFLPALILSVWWVTQVGKPRRPVLAALWALLACFAVWQITSRHRHASVVVELPAGNAVIASKEYLEEFSWLKQHTQPGEWFLQTNWLNSYFPLRLRSPIFLDGLWPRAETRPEYVELAVRQMAQQPVELILWSAAQAEPDYACCSREDHLGAFRTYLASHYTRIHVFSNGDEIWQLRQVRGINPSFQTGETDIGR
jgi:hypothetical protein